MAYLLLYGNGWSQRWRIAPEHEEQVRSQITQVGTASTGQLAVVDPGSDAEASLAVFWAHVAAAVVLDEPPSSSDTDSTGQYA